MDEQEESFNIPEIEQQGVQQEPTTEQASVPAIQYIEEPKKSNKIWIFVIISFVAMALIVALLILFLPSNKKLSNNELSAGVSFDTQENKEIDFNLLDEKHKILIDSVNTDSVDLIVQSEPIHVNVKINEEKKVDLNSDGVYELSIKLGEINGEKINLYVKQIQESICNEQWNCEDWSSCQNQIQTRTCADINSCGTIISKPITQQVCNETTYTQNLTAEQNTVLNNTVNNTENRTCSERGGVICNSSQRCSLNFINSSDSSRCCPNFCSTITQEILNCNNIDCFIEQSRTCNLSKLKYNFSANILGWVQNHSYYYEIKGLESNRCIFYSEILDVYGIYDNETRQVGLDSGKTLEEIIQEEQELNTVLSGIIGNDGTCRYPVANLTKYLQDLKSSYFSGSTLENQIYNCTGSLYDSAGWNVTLTVSP